MTISEKIIIPALVYGPIFHVLGEILYCLFPETELRIVNQGEIRISKKISLPFYELSDGQKVIVTTRKKVKRPKEINGVLFHHGDGIFQWQSHNLKELFLEEIKVKGLSKISDEIADSWKNKFQYKSEAISNSGSFIGLRPPQIGGLHAIGSHWSIFQDPATVIMPTGTGKTETMLAALIAFEIRRMIVIVPASALRGQTASKFINLGLLRKLEVVPFHIKNPIVGIINHRPTSMADLDIFNKCNVVISTMAALYDDGTSQFSNEIAKKIDTLIVDEAHHLPADTWQKFRDHFIGKQVLQFTATPYRRDGKLVDGKPIFNYSLSSAQNDGYFKPIKFHAVYEINPDEADKVIATEAVKRLQLDLKAGYDHLMMVRCDNIEKAKKLFALYGSLGVNPVIAHSKMRKTSVEVKKLYNRSSRVLICVDMFGEGFDLPQLKVAAIHDPHKSLAILLQFAGRFTRSSAPHIGDATVIANTANANVSRALERIYQEDADWNQLLSEYSSQASKSHAELVEFLNSSTKLEHSNQDKDNKISHHVLRPKLSTVLYKASSFQPKRFFEGIPKTTFIKSVWLNNNTNTLFFVTKSKPEIEWSRSKEIHDVQWDLFVIHYASDQQLLYIASSDKSSHFDSMAKAIGATEKIEGDVVFKCLGKINRLIFQNVGVRKYGRRNLSFAMYTGTDVQQALSMTETGSSIKSNLSGTGWENGQPISIGCSYKGRIWTRDVGTILEFINWCKPIGDKLLDPSIDTEQIYENVLIPKIISQLPLKTVLSIEFPPELIRYAEEKVIIIKDSVDYPLYLCEIKFVDKNDSLNTIKFQVITQNDFLLGEFTLTINSTDYEVVQNSGTSLNVKIGSKSFIFSDYFVQYPPVIRFVDLSEMFGNHLIESSSVNVFTFPEINFEDWPWVGVDIKKESIWKQGAERKDSIQWYAAKQYISGGFSVVFDDDSPGEAADLVCMKEEKDFIRLSLIHCKFTSQNTPGERVKDVVEVCSQAIRSSKWKWKFQELCKHLKQRESSLTQNRSSRYLQGSGSELNNFARLSRIKPIKAEIIIAQPGISINSISKDQRAVLAAAYSFLKETVDVELDVKCSK